jgi:hypothetical protein
MVREDGTSVRVAVQHSLSNVSPKHSLREVEISHMISDCGHPAVLPILTFSLHEPRIVSALAHGPESCFRARAGAIISPAFRTRCRVESLESASLTAYHNLSHVSDFKAFDHRCIPDMEDRQKTNSFKPNQGYGLADLNELPIRSPSTLQSRTAMVIAVESAQRNCCHSLDRMTVSRNARTTKLRLCRTANLLRPRRDLTRYRATVIGQDSQTSLGHRRAGVTPGSALVRPRTGG